MTTPASDAPQPPVATLNASLDAPIGETISFAGARVITGEALRSIVAERVHQVDDHGRTPERDQVANLPRDLPAAGLCYANAALLQLMGTAHPTTRPVAWPWHPDAWHPRDDPRANLVKAAALLWAAIDRLDHAPAADAALQPERNAA